jgi:hypothetical protein
MFDENAVHIVTSAHSPVMIRTEVLSNIRTVNLGYDKTATMRFYQEKHAVLGAQRSEGGDPNAHQIRVRRREKLSIARLRSGPTASRRPGGSR